MEHQWHTPHPPARFLVHTRNDNFVSGTSTRRKWTWALTIFRIALPWCFVREVPIDIELVSAL